VHIPLRGYWESPLSVCVAFPLTAIIGQRRRNASLETPAVVGKVLQGLASFA
jgi:hypothetical protein